jgi:hypothetical protein
MQTLVKHIYRGHPSSLSVHVSLPWWRWSALASFMRCANIDAASQLRGKVTTTRSLGMSAGIFLGWVCEAVASDDL